MRAGGETLQGLESDLEEHYRNEWWRSRFKGSDVLSVSLEGKPPVHHVGETYDAGTIDSS